MKNKLKPVIIIIVVSVFASELNAGQILKIGFVDMQKALEECESGKKAKSEIQDMLESRQREIDKLSLEIENLQKTLEEQYLISNEKKREKEIVINNKMEKYQKIAIEAKKEISKKESEFVEPIMKNIKDIINETGKKEGYNLILEKNYSSVLYGSKIIDLTDLVIKKLNGI